MRSDLAMPPPRSVFRVHKKMDSHIIVIKLVPGFSDDAILAIIRHSETLRAIILEMYGTGNAPNSRTGLLDAVRMASERDIVVVALTQCRQVRRRGWCRCYRPSGYPHPDLIPR